LENIELLYIYSDANMYWLVRALIFEDNLFFYNRLIFYFLSISFSSSHL